MPVFPCVSLMIFIKSRCLIIIDTFMMELITFMKSTDSKLSSNYEYAYYS